MREYMLTIKKIKFYEVLGKALYTLTKTQHMARVFNTRLSGQLRYLRLSDVSPSKASPSTPP